MSTKGQRVYQGERALEEARKLAERRRGSFESFPDFVADLSEPSWLVEGVLEREAFASVFAPPDSYKSFVMLTLGLSVATGRDFMGSKTSKGVVAYVATEGGRGLRRRAVAWARHHKINPQDIQDALFLVDSPQLADPNELAWLITELKLRPKPDLIVVDTLAGVFAGREENSSADMTALVEAFKQLQREFNCAVVVVCHTPKNVKPGQVLSERGHSSLRGAVDTALSVSVKERRITLACVKQKDAPRFSDIVMTTNMVQLATPTGQTIEVPVLVPATEEESPVPLPGNTEIDPKVEARDLPEAFVADELPAIWNCSRATAYRRLKRLIDGGAVASDNQGRYINLTKAGTELPRAA